MIFLLSGILRLSSNLIVEIKHSIMQNLLCQFPNRHKYDYKIELCSNELFIIKLCHPSGKFITQSWNKAFILTTVQSHMY